MTTRTPRIHIDHDRREVFVNGKEKYFPPSEYGVLNALITSNRAMTREELHQAIGNDYVTGAYGRTIDQYVTRLRRKLKPLKAIATVTGYGYRYDGNKTA